jgi:hypothetical protein
MQQQQQASTEKNKKMDTTRSPSALVNNIKFESNSKIKENNKIAFKPYDVLCGSSSNNSNKDERSSSELSTNINNSNTDFEISVDENMKRTIRVDSNKSADSISNNNDCNLVNKNYENNSAFSSERHNLSPNLVRKTESPSDMSNNKDSSPVIQSGFEVLNGRKNDSPLNKYAADAFGLASLPAFYSPADLDYQTNPAFRPPFIGSHASTMMAAASQQSQYLNYTRAKMGGDAGAGFPVCKDPYCTGCQFSAHNQKLLMGTPCGSGCTQCEYQRYGLAVAMNPYMQLNRSYVCNWELCCKRFSTSEEVLNHLRSHAATIQDPAVASTLLAAHQASVLNQVGVLFPTSALSRSYPNLAARYHPYAKSGAYGGSPYGPLSPYYSTYAGLYGQRIGASAHP